MGASICPKTRSDATAQKKDGELVFVDKTKSRKGREYKEEVAALVRARRID